MHNALRYKINCIKQKYRETKTALEAQALKIELTSDGKFQKSKVGNTVKIQDP